MLTGKKLLNFRNILNSSSKDSFRNTLFNSQIYNILQVNRVVERLTKERRQSIERRHQEMINEIEGKPNNQEGDKVGNFFIRLRNDKSHEEMMERYKKTVSNLDIPNGPLSKENYAKTKNDFDEKIWKKIAYVEPEKTKRIYRNMELEVNSKYKINKVVPSGKDVLRTGIIGYKMGMTGVWDKFGIYYPLTVIKIDRCQVVQVKTKDKEGYYSLQLGIGEKRIKKVTKSLTGHFIRANVPPKKDMREFRVSPENLLPLGYMLGPKHFIAGQMVDVRSKSRGKGTQGVMQRWNFSGGFASHGCSLKHRAPGSIGNREKPGRIWPGKKMAGHLGNEYVTIRNLLVYKIDYKNSLIFIKGSVPGFLGQVIEIKDAFFKKDKQFMNLPYPTFIPDKGKEIPQSEVFDGTIDKNELFRHANDEVLGVSDEEEEGTDEEGDDEESEAK